MANHTGAKAEKARTNSYINLDKSRRLISRIKISARTRARRRKQVETDVVQSQKVRRRQHWRRRRCNLSRLPGSGESGKVARRGVRALPFSLSCQGLSGALATAHIPAQVRSETDAEAHQVHQANYEG